MQKSPPPVCTHQFITEKSVCCHPISCLTVHRALYSVDPCWLSVEGFANMKWQALHPILCFQHIPPSCFPAPHLISLNWKGPSARTFTSSGYVRFSEKTYGAPSPYPCLCALCHVSLRLFWLHLFHCTACCFSGPVGRSDVTWLRVWASRDLCVFCFLISIFLSFFLYHEKDVTWATTVPSAPNTGAGMKTELAPSLVWFCCSADGFTLYLLVPLASQRGLTFSKQLLGPSSSTYSIGLFIFKILKGHVVFHILHTRKLRFKRIKKLIQSHSFSKCQIQNSKPDL